MATAGTFAQVQKALENVPQRVVECEFVSYGGSFEQFRLTLEDTCGNYHFMLELYDTQNTIDGPWRRAVLYFDHLAVSALMKSDGRASASPSYTGIDPFP